MILILFILLNFANLSLYLNGKYKLFLFSTLTILFVEPIFQKLLDPTLFGPTFNVFGFQRAQGNLIIILSFFFILIFKNKTSLPQKLISPVNRFTFLFIVFHVFNVLLSHNVTNSLMISIVSIVGPALFFYILLLTPTKIFFDNASFVRVIYASVIMFLLIGIIMYRYTSLSQESSDGIINRTGGGLWLSNISTQVLALLFPFVFSQESFKYSKIMRLILALLFILLLVISMSRTALIVYAIMMMMIFIKSRKKIMFIVSGGFMVFLILTFGKEIFNIDIIDLYSERFIVEGNALKTAESDTRFEIYKEGFSIIKGNEFFGRGISSFSDLNKNGFSNAHNIFVNIFVERGIAGLILIISFVSYFFYINNKCSTFLVKVNREYEFIRFLKIGFIGFLLIALTGNDMFVNSGFISGWPMYLIVFMLAIQLKKLNYILTIRESNA